MAVSLFRTCITKADRKVSFLPEYRLSLTARLALCKMIPQALRKGQGRVLIFIVFLFIVLVSIHKADLFRYETYFDQYRSSNGPGPALKSNAPIARKIWQIFSTPADSEGKHPNSIDTYFALRNPGMKTDLLRYLILWVEDGVYADLDTWALKPIDAWVPEHLKAEGSVRAVVGLEWD